MQIRRFNIIHGMQYGTPKEIWGFCTRSLVGTPAAISDRFIANNSELLGSTNVPLRHLFHRRGIGPVE